MRIKLFCLICLFTAVLTANAACAKTAEETVKGQRQKTIAVIKVSGNKAISSATILSKIKAKPGDVFSQDQLNADLKRLFGLGYFTDISIDVEDYETGAAVTFVVVERPLVSQINFTGNKNIRSEKLKKEMKTAENDMLDETKLKTDIEQLKTLYKKRGFQLIEMKYSIDMDKLMHANHPSENNLILYGNVTG